MLQQLITLDAAPAAAGGGMSGILMIVILIAIFYFMMIRPQQKKQKQIKAFREGLQKGDSIITAGGIYGKIKEIKEKLEKDIAALDKSKGEYYKTKSEELKKKTLSSFRLLTACQSRLIKVLYIPLLQTRRAMRKQRRHKRQKDYRYRVLAKNLFPWK